MRFSLISAIAAAIATASALDITPDAGIQELRFPVNYVISEYPDITHTDVAEFNNGETISLEYTATNNEDDKITIVGLGGAFRSPTTNEIKSNLSAQSVGPIILAPGDSEVFIQKIPLDLVPDNYLLTPQLFIAFQEDLKLVQARGQLAVVSDVPVSFFDPQLLVLEAILVATLGGLLYAVYSIWGKPYFAGTAPTKKKVVISARSTSVDPSWFPESHILQKKTKKAY